MAKWNYRGNNPLILVGKYTVRTHSEYSGLNDISDRIDLNCVSISSYLMAF